MFLEICVVDKAELFHMYCAVLQVQVKHKYCTVIPPLPPQKYYCYDLNTMVCLGLLSLYLGIQFSFFNFIHANNQIKQPFLITCKKGLKLHIQIVLS